MRILIVRHGDPDYEIDSLTEKGWGEAGHLAERLASENPPLRYRRKKDIRRRLYQTAVLCHAVR